MKRKVTIKLRPEWSFYVGQMVRYHSIIDEPAYTSGHKIKNIEIRHGRPIAFITGKTGYVCIEALSPEE